MREPTVTRRTLLGIAAAALASAHGTSVRADDSYPSRLVRLQAQQRVHRLLDDGPRHERLAGLHTKQGFAVLLTFDADLLESRIG